MRRMLIGAAMLALAAPGLAQVPGQHWGGRVGGYWVGGTKAPGGYRAYRRPVKGLTLAPYWLGPSFRVSDWRLYGLAAPTPGRHWARYYDDAVLIDDRGTVFDSIEGVDWDLHDLDMQPPLYAAQPAPPVPPSRASSAPPPPRHATDDAIAGGAVGAAVGAVAGGPHGRLGGALIAGGVGAGAGYAIGREADRRAETGAGYPPPPPGAFPPEPPMADAPAPPEAYGPPPRHHRRFRYYDAPDLAYAPPPPPMLYGPPPPPPVQRFEVAGGSTTVITSGGAGCGCGWGGAVTTVVVQNPVPVTTTTTTTDYIDQPVVCYRSYTTYRQVPTKLVRVVRYTKSRGKLQSVKPARKSPAHQ